MSLLFSDGFYEEVFYALNLGAERMGVYVLIRLYMIPRIFCLSFMIPWVWKLEEFSFCKNQFLGCGVEFTLLGQLYY